MGHRKDELRLLCCVASLSVGWGLGDPSLESSHPEGWNLDIEARWCTQGEAAGRSHEAKVGDQTGVVSWGGAGQKASLEPWKTLEVQVTAGMVGVVLSAAQNACTLRVSFPSAQCIFLRFSFYHF